VDGRPFRIAGVAREGFFGVEPGKFVDVWLPATSFDPGALTNPNFDWSRIVGRLKPGATREQLQSRLQIAFHHDREEVIGRDTAVPSEVRKQALEATIRVYREERASPASGGPCAPVVDHARRCPWYSPDRLFECREPPARPIDSAVAEMALRVSLGASRRRLIRQLLTESLMLSALAGGLGWLLARVAGPALIGLLSKESDPVRFALAMDTRVLLFCAGVCALSAVFFGLMPAGKRGLTTDVPPAACQWKRRQAQIGRIFVRYRWHSLSVFWSRVRASCSVCATCSRWTRVSMRRGNDTEREFETRGDATIATAAVATTDCRFAECPGRSIRVDVHFWR